jgi:hypothetical protein
LSNCVDNDVLRRVVDLIKTSNNELPSCPILISVSLRAKIRLSFDNSELHTLKNTFSNSKL